MERSTTRRGSALIFAGVAIVMVLAFSLSVNITPAHARARLAAPLCGDGSAPDYGFAYDLQQPHWTVGWQGYASEQTVTEVDTVLDQLNGDSIVQTMILIMPQEQVGIRVNCAVHFLRYMQLGEPTGERKDNGFVFLIVVEPTRIDVHYGVGLGLPALTASGLTNLNRATEAAYQSSASMDEALLTLVQGFDTLARSQYAPLTSPTLPPEPINQSSPAGSLNILTICGQLCMGIILLLFMLWLFSQMGRGGINFNPSGSGSRGSGFPMGGGRSSGPSSRGGSGSGRSNRGN
ncbi:MAG: hypothetical protein ABI986_09035 [Chloroflexota bacterium]